MIYGVIQKVELGQILPWYTFFRKDLILEQGYLTESKDLIEAYIARLMDAMESQKEHGERHQWTGAEECPYAYVIIHYTDAESWHNFYNSPEMQVFLPLKEEVYAIAGWTDLGYRLIDIETLPDGIAIEDGNFTALTPNQAEVLWNMASPL